MAKRIVCQNLFPQLFSNISALKGIPGMPQRNLTSSFCFDSWFKVTYVSYKTNWLQNSAGWYIKYPEKMNTPGRAECHIQPKTRTAYVWFWFDSRQQLCFFGQPALQARKTTARNFPASSIKHRGTNPIPADTSFNQSLWKKRIERKVWVCERGCRCEEPFYSVPFCSATL